MAKEIQPPGGSNPTQVKLIFRGLKKGEERPGVQISAFDRKGKNLTVVSVDEDGSFTFPVNILKKAHRVRIGPGGDAAEKAPSFTSLSYRAVDFSAVIKNGILDIGKGVWEGWLYRYRCVSGTVRRCRRSPWWYAELAQAARHPIQPLPQADYSIYNNLSVRRLSDATRAPGAFELDQLIAWPVRCSRICLGTVEVYRRVCCFEPWVFHDPRLEGLLEELESLRDRIPEIPDIPPRPGPDPAPFRSALIKEGALDERALKANQDLQTLRSLPADRVAEYINSRPYLTYRHYSCGSAVKVASGTLGPDGRFNICWSEFPSVLRAGCQEKYAYKVKQKLGPITMTIYNGVAAGHWYNQIDEVALNSYHPFAIACRDNGGPGDAFVYLDEIGDTDSSLLGTPDQANATSVGTPLANGGVAFPSSGPAGNGSHDRNWGGTLKLAIMFSESMRTIGAKYYRVSVTEANASGDPIGSREYITDGVSWNKAVAVPGGVDVVSVGLGPTSTMAPDEPQDNLYQIPFDGDLGANADWEADQYHVNLDTTSPRWNDLTDPAAGLPTKRRLVTIEIFDKDGQRLRPNGTPASGLPGAEIEAGFTFRRKFQNIGPTNMVPYGALTHLFWWDNRDVVSSIEDLRMNGGMISEDQCQFLNGTPTSTFGIGYRAYHPWALFQRNHRIWWKRGLGGGSDNLLPLSGLNVGVPPSAVGVSPTHNFLHMLNHPTPVTSRTKCAFTVFLRTFNKRTDGDNLNYHWDGDSAAFALDIEPTLICPPCPPCSNDDDEDDD